MLFAIWMLIVGTVCVLLWRRVAAITSSQIIAAGVLFIAGIGVATRPGTDWLD